MHEQIRDHMEIIGADGVHIGTVDRVEGDRIKLTRQDSGGAGFGGGHEAHHHYIPMGLVASVGEVVRLSANADVAVTFEEEQDGDGIAEDSDFEDDSGTGETDMGDPRGEMTGSAPQQTDVNVSHLIDESGRGRAE